ncbi:hypothetical protein [Nocardia brasiliensis]|uniref:hypothetical protein n=1 Tax=Nocardia brasiliensis TaxID=37326 RepID=UPI002458E690|nr:hypothetical protein [Nocardia brasiliensis]
MATNGIAESVVDYGEILTPANIAQFLATRDWTCQRDRTFDQVWVLGGGAEDRARSVLLPRDPSFVDYGRRLREALEAITSTYGWALAELAEQVAAVHADLFFVRVDQKMVDGTIPLRQASALLENIDQMIRAAAVSAHNPHSSGRGRIPDFVNEFLNDDIRMGHTKKGSFVITVAARIDDADQPEIDSSDQETETGTAPSFTRQVMTALAQSLETTRRFAANDGDFSGVDEAIAQGLKLQVVQALQDMGGASGLRSLDLSFEWAAAEPQRTAVPDRVSLDRSIIDRLPEIERRLIRRSDPERVTLVGRVKELRINDDSGVPDHEQGGEIVIQAEIGDRMRKVTIPLGPVDYDWAIAAHRARLPLIVAGELRKRGNAWRLNEPIEVDRSYLELRLPGLGSTTGESELE